MTLTAWVLTASALVTDAQGHRFRALPQVAAEAIADGCTRTPLFAGDDGRHCAVLLVVMAQRESSGKLGAVGDGGRSRGAWQSQTCRGACESSWALQVANILPIYRRSITTCVEPLALAASGSCTNKAGIRISRERMAEARRVLALLTTEGGS